MREHHLLHPSDPRSRRDFFRLAGLTTLGGSVVSLGACGGDDGGADSGDTTGTNNSGGRRDARILNGALDLENTVIAAYTAGAKLLRGRTLRIGTQFLEQEREHAGALTEAIKRLGGTPNKPKTADEYALGFPRLEDQNDVLTFAVDLENMAVRAYEESLPMLSTRALRQSAAAIATAEAEHLSVLLGALGKPQVPRAYVTGLA